MWERHSEKVSVIEIPRGILHLAVSCLSVPEETGQKPVHPAVPLTLLAYIWRCLPVVLQYCSVF